MGITYRDVMMYQAARSRGACFDHTLTLGHLALYLHRGEVNSLRKQYAAQFGRPSVSLAEYKWGDFADSFMNEFLDVKELSVVDASAYEGANIVHDLNEPVPETLQKRFDAIVDGGTLEHIFNIPIALSNLASMLKLEGTVFISTPANNLMGHGFYQFSPELMFRVFSEENGFALRRVALWEARFPSVELTRSRHIYEVADPQKVHGRVGLMSRRAAIMLVEAVKVKDSPMFSAPPVQSDYATAWDPAQQQTPGKSLPRRMAGRLLKRVPRSIAGLHGRRRFSLSNETLYRRLPE